MPQLARRPVGRVETRSGGDLAELAADVRRVKFSTRMRGKHQVGVLPPLPRPLADLFLLFAVLAESAVCPVSQLSLVGDAVDRLADHVGDGSRLGNHDHVGSLDLGDCRSGALGHGTDDVAACGLVTGGYDGP